MRKKEHRQTKSSPSEEDEDAKASHSRPESQEA
jgi:hypothetical protein